MAMNPYVGWGVTTLLTWFLNRSSKSSDSAENPAELSSETAELGTAIPVVMGRSLVQSPLVIYYGGFGYKAYTETYAAHSQFNAWPLVFSLIAEVLALPATGITNPGQPVTTSGGAGETSGPGTNKDKAVTALINTLYLWLLSWLINGRNLKTTIQKGFKYYLGYQQLCCVSGAGLRLRGIYLNPDATSNVAAWTGNITREDYPSGYTIHIDDEELFGGPDEGGGFVGDIRVYLGGPEQPADFWMIEQMSADSVQEELRGLTPAYRPFVSLVVPVAYIGKQSSIPTTWLDVQWIPNRLGLGGIGDDDVNPAEAIYEMIVNQEWGLNKDPEIVNVDSLKEVGKTLKEEGLGVTLKITNRTEVRGLIDNLCDHLDMIRYADPVTGKLTFKLIRDDYNTDNLPIIDQSVCSAIEFTRTVWSNSAGEIIARYTDRASLYDTSTVTENDPAVIAANDGDRNSQDMDFTYFTKAANAVWAANRELRQQGYPLASVTLTCNRKVASLRPGEVFKLNWAPYGISNLVMRITDVDLGDFTTGDITIEAMEDVFGVGKTTYGANDSTSWTRPETYPTGVQLFRYFEAPWELLQSKESYVYAAAVLPSNDTVKWNIWRNKDQSWKKTNGMTKWTPAGQLVGSLGMDGVPEDVVGFEVINQGGLVDLASRSTESGIALARNGSRILMLNNELMGWGTISQLPNGNFRVSNIIRATYDTVPANHIAGDTVYFLDYGYYANVTTGGPVCAAGYTASESYNITTASATEEEEFSNAKITALTTIRRSERPNPPGRIRMTSHMFSSAPRLAKAAGDLLLMWAIRNKNVSYGCVSQDDIIGYYTGMEFQAAEGLQTVIRAYLGSTMIHEEVLSQTAVEGAVYPETPTSFTYTWGQRCSDSNDFQTDTTIQIWSKLNGLESYQCHERTFSWKPPYIVDACETEEDALVLMQKNFSNGAYVIKFNDSSMNKSIPIESCPIIILGDQSAAIIGTIYNSEGDFFAPTGKALALTGPTTYEIVDITMSFLALTYRDYDEIGKLVAYKYDGLVFNKVELPNF